MMVRSLISRLKQCPQNAEMIISYDPEGMIAFPLRERVLSEDVAYDAENGELQFEQQATQKIVVLFSR